MKSKVEPKIKVVAYDPEDYPKKIIELAKLASKKYRQVFYYSFHLKKKELQSKWKNKEIYPERFRIIDVNVLNIPDKESLLPQLEEFIKKDVEFTFADLVIFDSISNFTDAKQREPFKATLTALLMRVLKKRIPCVLPILKKDINSGPINEVSKFIDSIIDWDTPDINVLVHELRELTDKLIGPESSQILIGAAKGETPRILLDQFEQEMGTILGPANVSRQIEDLRDKYTGEFI